MNARDLVLAGSYDYRLIAVSVVIAILPGVSPLLAAGHGSPGSWAVPTAMGIGIWSMHYTAMLAFSLPVPIEYHWPTVLLSLLIGILSSALAGKGFPSSRYADVPIR
jgi:NO-binding membrane sensor protein with MHYT domain